MSLSAAAWQGYLTAGILQESWIVRLYYGDESAYLQVGTRDTQDATLGYVLGCIKGAPSMRRSLDVVKCKASTSNVSLTLANVTYLGAALSAELEPGATRKYINRKVEVISVANGNPSATVTLYSGRLKSVQWDTQEVQLDIEARTPWDAITIPQAQSTITGKYFPVAYGNFTPNSSTNAARVYNSVYALFPVPIEYSGFYEQACLVGHSITANGRLHIYESAIDQFCPLYNTADGFSDTTEAYGLGYKMEATDTPLAHSAKFKAVHSDNALDTFTNAHNSVDATGYFLGDDDNDTYAHDTLADGDEGRLYITFPGAFCAAHDDLTIDVRVRGTLLSGNSPNTVLELLDSDGHGHGSATITLDGSNSTKTFSITGPGVEPAAYYYLKVTTSTVTGTPSVQIRIYDVRIKAAFSLDATKLFEEAQKLNDLQWLYCGADGLPRSWDAGALTAVHEMHRDLLIRFAGMTADDPQGWADVTSFPCYWWATEPVSLAEVLDQAQFEGQFIFTWSASGGPRYIKIDVTGYAAGDVAATFDPKQDVGLISYSTTPVDELVTKMIINSWKHPAADRYLKTYTVTNSTARTAWNVGTLENVVEYNLDMINAGSTTTGDSWDDLITLLTGVPKKLIKLEVLNPKFFNLEIGDIVQVSGDSAYYMVTEERRSPGKLGIAAREVG